MMTTSSSSMRDQMRAACARLRAWKAVPPMASSSCAGGHADRRRRTAGRESGRRSSTAESPKGTGAARKVTRGGSLRSPTVSQGVGDPMAFGGGERRGRRHAMRKLQAARQGVDAATRASWKRSRMSSTAALGIEALAGEDVDPDVAVVGEGVGGDVALGDEDEAGYAPVFRLRCRRSGKRKEARSWSSRWPRGRGPRTRAPGFRRPASGGHRRTRRL